MPKFTVELSAIAIVRSYALIEAESQGAAEAKATTDDVLNDVVWKYDGLFDDSPEARPCVESSREGW